MLLQAPEPSPYDLSFTLLGIHVRVSFTFWIGTFLFGFQLVQGVDQSLENSPGFVPLLILWAICVLISIWIHEMGHALAFRRYGIESHIVLYHFGGLAIPTGSRSRYGMGTTVRPWQQFVISGAGPGIQMLSGLALVLGLWGLGYFVEGWGALPFFIESRINNSDSEILPLDALRAAVVFFLYPSVLWALLNLIPVYPLDGGQMTKAIVDWRGGDSSIWLWISVVSGGLVTLYAIQRQDWFLALLFGSFAVSNYQSINSHSRY
jgi:stage IV sporulation protein FB